MLKLLHYHIAETEYLPPFPSAWGAPPPPLSAEDRERIPRAIASILWSDVGSTFYEKCTIGESRPGWVTEDANVTELVWSLRSDTEASSEEDSSVPWQSFDVASLPALGEEMSAYVKKDMAEQTADRPLWTIDPASPGLFSFVNVRGAKFTAAPRPEDEAAGYRTTNADGSETVVVYTSYSDIIGPRVLICYAHNLRSEHLPSLLAKLDKSGKKAGKKEGWVWGYPLDDEIVRKWKELPGRKVTAGRRGEEMGHLLAVAWYGAPEQRGTLLDKQVWTWC